MIASNANFQQTLEGEKRQLLHELDDERKQNSRKIKQLSEENDRQKEIWQGKLQDCSRQNAVLEKQLAMKQGECEQLNNAVVDLEQFSKKQLELIKGQEQKINYFEYGKQDLVQLVQEKEGAVLELQGLNRKYIDMIAQSRQDVIVLKQQLNRLLAE